MRQWVRIRKTGYFPKEMQIFHNVFAICEVLLRREEHEPEMWSTSLKVPEEKEEEHVQTGAKAARSSKERGARSN